MFYHGTVLQRQPFVDVLKGCKLINKRLQRKCFPVNIVKILQGQLFLIGHPRWLLLVTSRSNMIWYDQTRFAKCKSSKLMLADHRSSHPGLFYRKGVFKNLAKVTGKHQRLFIKKEILTQVLSCEFCKVLRTFFSQNTSGGCL